MESVDFVDLMQVDSVWGSSVLVARHFALAVVVILSLVAAVYSESEVPEALLASAHSQEVRCSRLF